MRREDILQFHAAQWLRANDITFFHVPNEGQRSAAQSCRAVALGLVPGVHDLIVLLPMPYGPMFIELKAKAGRYSTHQKNWHERITKIGYASHHLKAATVPALLRMLSALIPARYISQSPNTYLAALPPKQRAALDRMPD